MAELYFNHLALVAKRGDISASSAGLMAYDGAKLSHAAQMVMDDFTVETANFRSRQLTRGMALEADLIIVMTIEHRQAVVQALPEVAGKTKLLLEYSFGGSVSDPYGGSYEHYRHVFDSMRPALDNIFAVLNK